MCHSNYTPTPQTKLFGRIHLNKVKHDLSDLFTAQTERSLPRVRFFSSYANGVARPLRISQRKNPQTPNYAGKKRAASAQQWRTLNEPPLHRPSITRNLANIHLRNENGWSVNVKKTMIALRPSFSRTNAQSDDHLKAAQNEAELCRNLLTLNHILNI